MKRWIAAIASACFSVGCQTTSQTGSSPDFSPAGAQTAAPAPTAAPAAPVDPVVARVANRQITRGQLTDAMIAAHGLDSLMQLVQLELSRRTVEEAGVVVTPEDIQRELQLTLTRMFPDDVEQADYPKLMEQFLQQQKISRSQFELAMEINANLRKVAEPMVRERITEESLREAFNALYGETIQVRHIQLANMQEVGDAQRRLAAGESFEKVATELSRNPRSRELGGQLPPFSRQMSGLPEAFKDAAFELQKGEVSDAVQTEGWYHLIRLEERFEPRAMSFEDHREAVRKELEDRMQTASIRELRAQLAQRALDSIVIDDPVLKAQFNQRLQQSQAEVLERDALQKQWEAERQRLQEGQETPGDTTLPAAPADPDLLPSPETPAGTDSTDTPAIPPTDSTESAPGSNEPAVTEPSAIEPAPATPAPAPAPAAPAPVAPAPETPVAPTAEPAAPEAPAIPADPAPADTAPAAPAPIDATAPAAATMPAR